MPELMEAAMAEARDASGHPEANRLLCQAVEDMALLMRSLPPLIHSQRMQKLEGTAFEIDLYGLTKLGALCLRLRQVPQLAALYYNDCHAVASRLAILSFEYSSLTSAS
eukprot:scaffold666_cov49-Prasinocladus_malaysianus.AAC.1